MGQVVVVGFDLAKSVFQVHGVDRDGEVVATATKRGWEGIFRNRGRSWE
jgi:transposase